VTPPHYDLERLEISIISADAMLPIVRLHQGILADERGCADALECGVGWAGESDGDPPNGRALAARADEAAEA
jgi:hypothetical protein